MKKVIIAAVLLFTGFAHAADFIPVPKGTYTGIGTWSDNLGCSGTVSIDVKISFDSRGRLHNGFVANFSDGRHYQGSVRAEFGPNSTYTYVAQIHGHAVPVGHGVSTPDSYQTTDLALSPTETFSEIGHNSTATGWHRNGSITNKTDGRVTLISIDQTRVSGD